MEEEARGLWVGVGVGQERTGGGVGMGQIRMVGGVGGGGGERKGGFIKVRKTDGEAMVAQRD